MRSRNTSGIPLDRRDARARRRLLALAGVASLGLLNFAPPAAARADGTTVDVPVANPKTAGTAAPNVLTTSLLGHHVALTAVAQGSTPVENPMLTANGVHVSHYGYLDDAPMVAAPGANGNPFEATKTEPDKNTYLVLQGLHGADSEYDYGTHFLYQGHESGASLGAFKRAGLTRINLDADGAHRVTVLATQDTAGQFLPVIDGSMWYPFSQRLLFTAELSGTTGGVWQATADFPSSVVDISGALGRGGYEGIQADSVGNLWIVEDSGGPTGAVNTKAKQPNSFIFRFVPENTADLTAGGHLQVLQVTSLAHPGQPIVFHPGAADADILSQDVADLHTYGLAFATRWITIHDTAVDGFVPFSANALAKTAGGTPFKRPENGNFKPRTGFRDFFFTETGDTNADTQAGAAFGGFGGLYHLHQASAAADSGTLSLFFLGDVAHTGLDNITFLTEDLVMACEDCGDLLHDQRDALDSLYVFDTRLDYGVAGNVPVRVVAEGRDAASTFDSGALDAGTSGFQNEGDNEITGIHVSNGDPTVNGLIGAQRPQPFRLGWRIFWTQQHGDNATWEIVSPIGG